MNTQPDLFGPPLPYVGNAPQCTNCGQQMIEPFQKTIPSSWVCLRCNLGVLKAHVKPLPYVRGSETSKEAAIAAEPNAGTQRRKVLDILRRHPSYGLTDHEMQLRLLMNPSTQRPRRIELVAQGWVKDSGETRLTPSGKRAVVWVAAK